MRKVAALLASALLFSVGTLGCVPELPEDELTGPTDQTGGDPDPTPGEDDLAGPTPAYSVVADGASAELQLGTSQTVTLTFTSENGFAGPLSLEALDVPEGWTVELPASVTLAADQTAQVEATIQIASNAEAATRQIAFAALSAGDDLPQTVPYAVTVKPELVVSFPHVGGTRIQVRAGTTIIWRNIDTSTAHRIHSNGGGLDHQGDQMAPGGGTYEATIAAPGDYAYYCHNHNDAEGVLVVR